MTGAIPKVSKDRDENEYRDHITNRKLNIEPK